MTRELMRALRDKGVAMRAGNRQGKEKARQRVDDANVPLVSVAQSGGRTVHPTGTAI